MSISANLPAVQWIDPAREAAFSKWLAAVGPRHHLDAGSLRIASADASFRRYLRIDSAQGSRIIMDAPPNKENSQPFVTVAALMAKAGLLVPRVFEWLPESGFLLLSDLGDQTMMGAIDSARPAHNLGAYQQAIDALIIWQLASKPGVLPPYDATLLRRELELFPHWYVAQHRGRTLEGEDRKTLDSAFGLIVERNLAWRPVYVHRDFMPRNLMVNVPAGAAAAQPSHLQGIGILDFQDAVYGPITYDIACLMRDAFLSWDEDFVLDVTIRYWEKARKAGLPVGDDFGEFYKGVEWMGLQRHLKVAGIFARLTLRDGKAKYLADTPRFIHYIRSTCHRYVELRPLMRLIDRIENVQPTTGFAYGRVS